MLLTSIWTHGRNRHPSTSHILHLRKSFNHDLRRTDPSNTLRVACRPEDFDRMIAELKRQGETRADWKQRTPDAWPSFLDGQRVNPEPVELMDGQHRVEALKEHLKGRKDAKDEGWWLCDIYNQGGSECSSQYHWSFDQRLISHHRHSTPGTVDPTSCQS